MLAIKKKKETYLKKLKNQKITIYKNPNQAKHNHKS